MTLKEFIKWLESEDRQNWEIERAVEDLLKEIINNLESNPNPNGSISPNIQHWIEQKQIELRKLIKGL